MTTGDANIRALAPDADSLNGKILRIMPDGTIPAGNPGDNPIFSSGQPRRRQQGRRHRDPVLGAGDPGRRAMTGMRFTPKGYGGRRRAPDGVKRDGWKVRRNRRANGAAKVRRTGLLAMANDDDRLTWPERELVRQLGETLYGKREPEVRHC